MRHVLLIILLLIGTANVGKAQITTAEAVLKKQSLDTLDGWKKGGLVTLNVNQVALTNWVAGGLNSVSVIGFINIYANHVKGDLTWNNSLDMGYGVIRQGSGKNLPWIKNDDKINLTSIIGKRASDNWYYAGLFNFRSQFADGYETPASINKVSDLLAPAYVLVAIGMDLKPNENFTLFMAPLTNKTTLVMDQALANLGAYGVEKATFNEQGQIITGGKNIRAELGGYLRLGYQSDLMENVRLFTKLDLFSNYLNNPLNIDVNWESGINMKVNEYLTANLAIHLIYDDDIDISVDTDNDGLNDTVGPRTQFKQLFGAGFSYKF